MSGMIHRFCLLLAATAGALTGFGLAGAQAGIESAWSAPSGTAVRLLGGAKDGGQITGGIEIRLTPGWKTYWRYPGDSGIPPRFDWSGSHNVEHVEILWPAPVRFDDGGSFSIGYKKDVVIPFKVTPQDASQPVELKLALDFAICEKICQPANAVLFLDVPAAGAAPSPAALAAALDSVPRPIELGAAGDTGIDKVSLETDGGTPIIRIEARVKDAAGSDLFVEGPTEDWALPLARRQEGQDGRAVFLVPVDGVPKGADITATGLRFTLVDGARATETQSRLSTR
jgi:DsbC/DsbD-like thiol-disulfide interchange protein